MTPGSGTRQRPPTSPGPGADFPSRIGSPRGQPLPPGRGGGASVGAAGRKDTPTPTPSWGESVRRGGQGSAPPLDLGRPGVAWGTGGRSV